MLNDPQIFGLFPKPVILTNINREFTKQERDFFDHHSKFTTKNVGNLTSADNYLTRHPQMATIKQEITDSLQMFFDNIIKPSVEVRSYITQAWLNYTYNNQYHHKHNHANTFLSGVLYIDTDPETDKITFFDDAYYPFKFAPKEWNWYNAESWFFKVKPGDIIVFPSWLTHAVEATVNPNIRTSLAFNSFLKGQIGTDENLTELMLTE